MHGTAVSTGVDINGAPTMACQCHPDWAGAEYVPRPLQLPPPRPRVSCSSVSSGGRCESGGGVCVYACGLCFARGCSCNTHCRAACNYHGTICEPSGPVDVPSTSTSTSDRTSLKSVITLGTCVCDEGCVTR
jgi:hypothetical protein